MQRNTDKNAGRIQAVESGLKSVNASVKGLDYKFDKKLDAMMNLLQSSLASRNDNGSDSSRPLHSPEREPPVQGHSVDDVRRRSPLARVAGLPPPAQLRMEENARGELDRLFAKEDYRINTASTGKNQLCSEGQIVKPYICISQEQA